MAPRALPCLSRDTCHEGRRMTAVWTRPTPMQDKHMPREHTRSRPSLARHAQAKDATQVLTPTPAWKGPPLRTQDTTFRCRLGRARPLAPKPSQQIATGAAATNPDGRHEAQVLQNSTTAAVSFYPTVTCSPQAQSERFPHEARLIIPAQGRVESARCLRQG